MKKPGKSKTLCSNVEDHRIWRFDKGYLAVFLVSGGVVLQLPRGRYIVQKRTQQKGEGVDYSDRKPAKGGGCGLVLLQNVASRNVNVT
jgi:hypothetical protein